MSTRFSNAKTVMQLSTVCVFFTPLLCIVSRLGFCWKWGSEMICFERGERLPFGWWKCLSIQTLIWQLPWSFLQWNVVGPYLLLFFLLEISPCDSTSCWEFFFHLSPTMKLETKLGNMHKTNQQTLEKSEVFQLLEHNWGWNSVVINLVHLHLCI